MRKTRLRKNNGITLIALVITIIVLLILAGVAISMLSGENGILSQSKNAKTKTEKTTFIEQLKIATLGAMTNENHKLDKNVLRSELIKLGIKEEDIMDDGMQGYIVKKEKNVANIKSNGEVIELEGVTENDLDLDMHFITNNSKYKCRYGMITGIGVDKNVVTDKVSDLQAKLPDGYTVCDKDGNEIQETDPLLLTGMAIKKDGTIVARVVVYGEINDLNGIDMGDAGKYAYYFNNSEVMEDYVKVAADVNRDNKINTQDANIVAEVYSKEVQLDQNQYATNPSDIIVETDSYLQSQYREKLQKNVTKKYTIEIKKSGNWYVNWCVPEETTVENLMDALPEKENIEIQRSGSKLDNSATFARGDTINYKYDGRYITVALVKITT